MDPKTLDQMFGCNIADFEVSVRESITYKTCGIKMVVMSMLSDAQHEIEFGMKETARQTINRAKYLLGQVDREEVK